MTNKGNGGYDVGFGKPPKETQFKKGQSGNPKGRPKKKRSFKPSQSDMGWFMNTVIDVRESGQVTQMTRREALYNKMFESALKGSVTAQKFLYQEFASNDEIMAKLMNQFSNLMYDWVIDNPNFGKEDPPHEVIHTIQRTYTTLNHYYPSSYPLSDMPFKPLSDEEEEEIKKWKEKMKKKDGDLDDEG